MRAYLLLFSLLFVFACGEETADPVDISGDLEYFPLELNRPVFYDQDSIVLRATLSGIAYDTARAQVREMLVEQFELGNGTQAYRGERWQRRDDASPWRFSQSYVVTRSDQLAIRSEDNLQFTKLVFPIRTGRNWDGNVAFDPRTDFLVGGEFIDVYNFWAYRYASTDFDTSYNGIAVADVVTVDQANETNAIELRRAYERYAPGIGLVERFIDARHTQCRECCNQDFARCSELTWNEKAEKGFILHQRLRAVR